MTRASSLAPCWGCWAKIQIWHKWVRSGWFSLKWYMRQGPKHHCHFQWMDMHMQEELLKSSMPDAALRMRQDLKHWNEALDLAEQIDPKSVPEICKQHALKLEVQGHYTQVMYFQKKLYARCNWKTCLFPIWTPPVNTVNLSLIQENRTYLLQQAADLQHTNSATFLSNPE